MTIYSTTSNAPRSGMQLSFGEEFNGTMLPDDPAAIYNTTFPGNYRWLAPNGEKQIYLDRDYRAADGSAVGINPFSMGDGTLTITARPTPAADLAKLAYQPYTSGMINTAQTAEFKYGYIEFRADFPGGKGLWPALWLRSSDSSVRSEIDVVELIGSLPNSLFQTVHSADGTVNKTVRAVVTDLTAGYHTYGVDWQPDRITFYLDGKAMGSTVTPESAKVPMYLIANMAVGGTWPGNPDGTTPWPAQMKIDYMRVWQDASVLASKTVTGGTAADVLAGNDGSDVIYGNGGNDTIFGAAGNDKIFGGAGDDRLLGGMGNDTIDGGGGADFLAGGAGNDTYVINTTGATIYELATGGVDTVRTTLLNYTLPGNIENLTFAGTGNFRGVGGLGDNVITGGAGNDTLISSAGNDRVDGGAGNDNIDAGIGNDVIIGGAGSDTLRGGDGADVFVIRSGETGLDTVMDFSVAQDKIDLSGLGITSLAQALAGASFNKLVFGGETMVLNNVTASSLTASNFIFAGTSGAVTSVSSDASTSTAPSAGLTVGTAGNDMLEGTTGADTLTGGKGDDVYIVDHLGDVVVELASGGYDTVMTTLSSYTLSGQLEALTYTGDSTFRGVGNSGANLMISEGGSAQLVGGAGDDTLIGSGGADRLTGGLGNDVLVGGGGNDTLVGNEGSDTFVFKAGTTGRVLITDFAAGVDHIDMRGTGIASFDDVLSHAVASGTSTVVTVDALVVTLQNTQPSLLTAADFVF